LTSSDYTLRVFNIPKEMQVPNVKEIILKMSSDIKEDNIHIAKRFDDRIQTFKDLIAAAKVLKDMRTIKFREIKGKNPDYSTDKIMEMLLDED